MMIPIVGPFRSEAAVIIHHAHMGPLTPGAELLRCIDCEDNRLVAARVGTVFAVFELDHPYVVVSHDVVPSIRHDFLPEDSPWAFDVEGRAGRRPRQMQIEDCASTEM